MVRAREPAPFWRENVVAVVILLRVLARMSSGENNLSNVRSSIIFLSGEGSISFNKDNSVTFSGEKRYSEAFRGVYFLENNRKKL